MQKARGLKQNRQWRQNQNLAQEPDSQEGHLHQRGKCTSLTIGLGSLKCAVGHDTVDGLDKSKHRQTGLLCPIRASQNTLCMERTIPKASETMRDLYQGILAEADLVLEGYTTECV